MVAVVVGGMLTPGYSQLSNAISELTAAGVPARFLLTVLFVLYDGCLLVFAVAVPRTVIATRSRAVIAGAILLALVVVAGLGMSTMFPAGRSSDPITATGWVHIGLAAIASLGSMGAVASFAAGTAREPEWRWFSRFSFACVAAIFVSGLWAATMAAQLSPVMGLAERTTIGIFMIWLFVFAATLFKRSSRAS